MPDERPKCDFNWDIYQHQERRLRNKSCGREWIKCHGPILVRSRYVYGTPRQPDDHEWQGQKATLPITRLHLWVHHPTENCAMTNCANIWRLGFSYFGAKRRFPTHFYTLSHHSPGHYLAIRLVGRCSILRSLYDYIWPPMLGIPSDCSLLMSHMSTTTSSSWSSPFPFLHTIHYSPGSSPV
jgi:hypothetical protein